MVQLCIQPLMIKNMKKNKTTIFLFALVVFIFSGCSSNIESQKYSWEIAQAKVLETGDLVWAPEPFLFEKRKSVRYIDFENGDDSNDGLTKNAPWKQMQ